MSYSKEARTQFANRALVVSDLVNMKFRARRFSGAVTRVVNVEPPNTESTGGGKMARETITLVPESDRVEGAPVVVGFIDVGTSNAEIRTYGVLADRHQQRFGNLPFDLDKVEYDTFLADLRVFLTEEGMITKIVDETDAEKATESASRTISQSAMRTVNVGPSAPVGRVAGTAAQSSSSGVGGIIVGVLFGIAIGVLTMLLMRP